jgi:hypothetical protein
MSKLDIEARVAISLAAGRYLRAAQRFEAANKDLTEACKSLRNALPKESRFVANIEHKHYLLTADKDGNFHVEELDTI